MAESRLKNSMKNLSVAWVGMAINMVFKFIVRRFFTQYISDEYLGLDAVFTNVIGMLNMSELGIGVVISCTLYKPLADRNEDMISGIMQLLRKVYRIIALIIAGIGFMLLPFVYIIAPEARNLSHVYLLFIMYVLNSCVSYLFTYKGILATADQKNYIPLKNHYFCIIISNLFQIVVICLWKSFVIYVVVQTIFTLLEGILLSLIMDKHYPLLKRNDKFALPKEYTQKIWKDIKYIAWSKIGVTIIGSTDNIILSRFVGLTVAGVYSNYALVKASVLAIVSQFVSAISASIGNLVAKESEKQVEYFWWINFITASLYSVTTVCMFNLMQPLISYWLGEAYIMDYSILSCVCASYFLYGIRTSLVPFATAHGAFRITAVGSVCETSANLLLSVILAMKMGTVGVILGTIISSVFVGQVFDILNLQTKMIIDKKRYIIEMVMYTIATIFVTAISMVLCDMVSMHWYIRMPLGVLISCLVFLVVWLAFFGRKKECKNTIRLFGSIFTKIINR